MGKALKYTPYTKRQREEAATWLLENDRRLYADGTAMQVAAIEFGAAVGYQVTGHFLGRVAANLRRQGRLRYVGSAPQILSGAVCPVSYPPAVWGRIQAACARLLAAEGAGLTTLYIARRIRDGTVPASGSVCFLAVPNITLAAVEWARDLIRV